MHELLRPGLELDYDDYDICTVACLLKAYVRELPTPLIPPETYPHLSDFTSGHTDKQLTKFIKSSILSPMSHQTRSFLGHLVYLLNAVKERSGVNHMGAKNLAIVWTPNLIRHERAEDEMACIKVSHLIVEYMINHAYDLF